MNIIFEVDQRTQRISKLLLGARTFEEERILAALKTLLCEGGQMQIETCSGDETRVNWTPLS